MNMSDFTMQDLEKLLKEINDDDLKTMFNTSSVAMIKGKSPELITEQLLEYWDYDIPVRIGDVIEFENEVYTVTCIYTDNSADLLNAEGTHKLNKGFYKVPYVEVGKLTCITI